MSWHNHYCIGWAIILAGKTSMTGGFI